MLSFWEEEDKLMILKEFFHELYPLLTGVIFIIFTYFEILVVEDSLIAMRIIEKDLNDSIGINKVFLEELWIGVGVSEQILGRVLFEGW